MTSLFISYSRQDIESARKLTEAFKGQDLDFWIDWEGIPPTVDWWREIEKGIEEADIFLFLLSPASCQSDVCRREIAHAVTNGKRLVPVVVRDVKAAAVPQELRHLNWIFLRETDDFDAAFRKLITAIQTDYAWVQAHRELQVKALEWERSNHKNAFLLRGEELQDAEQQLVTNAAREPQPTDLQREYVLRSRQASDRQRRIVTGIAIAGVIALAALAIFGFVQAGLATANAQKEQAASTLAFSNASTAQAASTLAFDNASTAQANAEEAERQSQIALARQFAAQAQAITTTRDSRQMIAALLAVQSMKLFPTLEAAQVLLNDNAAAQPVSRVTHEDIVNALAVSPDGNYIVSASEDSTARVWEMSTGQEVARMTHDWGVTSVAFSPDGKHVISGSWDGTARVWEAATGEEVSRMVHDEWIATVAFSPDGRHVVSGGGDGTARVWDALTGEEVSRIIHEWDVLSLAFSPDGRYVASGEDGGTAHVWEALTGRVVSRMVHNDIVWAVAISPDSQYLATQIGDNTVHLWEIATGRELARMTHTQGPSRGGGGAAQEGKQSVAFSPDGKYVASASDVTACVWEVPSGREHPCMNHDGGVSSVIFSPNGRHIVSGSSDGTARLWEAATGKEVARMTHDAGVTWLAIHPEGKYVVSGGEDNTARVWKGKADLGKEVPTWQQENLILGFNSDQTIVATIDRVEIDESEIVRIREFPGGKEIARLRHEQVENAVFSADGKKVITEGGDGMIRFWEIRTGTELASIPNESRFGLVFFSTDSQYVISNNEDQTVRIWEVSTGREVSRIENVTEAFAFSPNGKHLATGSWDGRASVWEIASGREVAHTRHQADVRAVIFTPDGKYVVSAACDETRETETGVSCTSTIRVWDASTGEQVASMKHENVVKTIRFSPDGKYLLSGACELEEDRSSCGQPTVRLWDVLTGRELIRTNNYILFVRFSPSGTYLLSEDNSYSGEQRLLAIWEVSSGEMIAPLNYSGSLNAFEFSEDEKYIVGGGTDGTARVWEVAGGREISSMTHDEWVRSVAFSPDDQFVASAADNDSIRVWEAMSGRELARIIIDGLVDSLSFSEDGKYISWEGSTDDSLQSRAWQPAELIAEACAVMPRNLTRLEWDQYVGDALRYQAVCPNLPLEPEVTMTASPAP